MNLIQRIGYFSVGLFFGIIILIFFLGGKRTSCDYSPTARVLKNIRIKDRVFSKEAMAFFETHQLDTNAVSGILNNGSVDFGKSKTYIDPCKIYYISGEVNTKVLELQIENCDSIATVQLVKMLEN
ncbi:hypothetical protein LZ575_02040 [Antarcticibacterium sp. 1MA-6-2]|uniref:hypothetical protein n=1 Tax=Antarcticibacterium sp. 1MA-6-2 TaxID=2908210 RepID=UPI001F226781|nr:hypothetical protein [Antarcticibacterium sp. 1MA-6-2]UJH91538.1 hypothetical protein LZ575_02040 [Antarcticibacterium sp. 1MA-6-2]